MPDPTPCRPTPRSTLRFALSAAVVAVLVLPGLFPSVLAPPAAAAPAAGPYADWAEGPVRFLLTPAEERRWKKVRTEEEAERFVDLFWSKRDPDLETPVNELKQEFDRRVAIADANFGGEDRRGALTDRGQVFIVLGEPRAVQQRVGEDQVRQYPERTTREGDETRIFWEYDTADLPVRVPSARLLVGFIEEVRGAGEFVLDRSAPGATLMLRALSRAPKTYVVHPDLERPVHPVEATPPPTDPAPVVVGEGRAEPAPEAAGVVDPELAGWFLVDPAPWPEGANLRVTAGAGMNAAGGEGPRPAWLQLDLPADAPEVERMAVRWQAAGAEGGDAGEVPEPNLRELTFERFPLNDGFAYQAVLPLPPGEYTLQVAAGSGPRPLAVGSADLGLETIPADATWLSEIYAAPHVQQRPDEPLGSSFLVAGWHLVPDPVVVRGQNLSYFGYLTAPADGAPPTSLSASVALSRDGRSLGSPFREMLEPSAVRDGLWMYGSSIAVGGLPEDGEYLLTFRVRDRESGVTRSVQVPFRLVAPASDQ